MITKELKEIILKQAKFLATAGRLDEGVIGSADIKKSVVDSINGLNLDPQSYANTQKAVYLYTELKEAICENASEMAKAIVYKHLDSTLFENDNVKKYLAYNLKGFSFGKDLMQKSMDEIYSEISTKANRYISLIENILKHQVSPISVKEILESVNPEDEEKQEDVDTEENNEEDLEMESDTADVEDYDGSFEDMISDSADEFTSAEVDSTEEEIKEKGKGKQNSNIKVVAGDVNTLNISIANESAVITSDVYQNPGLAVTEGPLKKDAKKKESTLNVKRKRIV